jgi:anti-sigma-K factor RskA
VNSEPTDPAASPEEASIEVDASLYVLGLLPPDEASRFEAAVASNPELAGLVASLETGAAALAWTAPPRDPPAALRGRILARVKQEETDLASVLVPFPGLAAWIPWAIAACLMVIVGCLSYDRYHIKLLVDSFLLRDQRQQIELDHVQSQRLELQNRLDDALSRLAADDSLRSQLAALKARDELSQIKIATLASLLKDAPRAMAVVAWDADSQRGILQPLNMPHKRPDQDYQLWIIDPGYKTPVSAGIFDPAARANFAPVQPITKANQFAISLEKKGGSPAPEGPIVLVGE